MSIEAIALTAVTLLSQYFSQTGEAFAKKAREKLADKAGELYQAVKKKFQGDPYAAQTLTRAEEKPESDGRQLALKQLLIEKMEDDPLFVDMVHNLIEVAKANDTRNVIASGRGSVAIGGNVADSTIITGDKNKVTRNKYNPDDES